MWHKRTKVCRIFMWVPKTKGTLQENANPRKDPTEKNAGFPSWFQRLWCPKIRPFCKTLDSLDCCSLSCSSRKAPIPANLNRCGKCACRDCPGCLQDLHSKISLPVQFLLYFVHLRRTMIFAILSSFATPSEPFEPLLPVLLLVCSRFCMTCALASLCNASFSA